MTVARGTVAGATILGSSDVAWTFTPGVTPNIAEIDVAPGDFDRLMAGGTASPVTLELSGPQGGITLRRVYVIEERPSGNPNIKRVAVADERWKWPYEHITRSFNIRRHVGVKRVRAGGGLPQLDPLVDEVAYAPWSLRNGVPWTARDALRDVFGELFRRIGGGNLRLGNLGPIDAVPIENLELDDSADSAIRILLGYFPEAQVTMAADGATVVYSRASGGEAGILERAGPPMVERGTVQLITQERLRPREVHVLFDTECEVRLDFTEVDLGQTVARNPDGRYMENVLPVPDHELLVPGLGQVAQNTWITFPQALAAWNAGGVPGLGSLSIEDLRIMMVPYVDLWAPLRLAGARDPDADWSARIATIQQHFRQTYRINQRWVDRYRVVNAYLVATIDRVTGSRAPSPCWQDYCFLNTQRSLLIEQASGPNPQLGYAINVNGYPSGGQINDPNAIVAPLKPQILDSDQGIIGLDFVVDPNRMRERMLPSKMDNVPTADLKSFSSLLAFNAAARVGGNNASKLPQLSGTHRVIMIVTMIPASPNSDKRLYRVKRKPSEVSHLLPQALRSGLTTANGPIMEVRVGTSYETARIAWVDGRENDIERLFGLQEGDPNLSDLVINEGAGRGGGAASLDAIADAVAARVYAGFADRVQGQKEVTIRAEAQLDGFLDAVRFRIDRRGVASTGYSVSPRGAQLDALSLMPQSVRHFILKTAQPGK